jgi:hypothetical protein
LFPYAIDTGTALNTAVATGGTIGSTFTNITNSALLAMQTSSGPLPGTLSWRGYARLATAAALPANTYSGTPNFTLTASANGALTVDGKSVNVNDRILVKNEATATHNGIYVVTAAGGSAAQYVLTRTADYDNSSWILPAHTVAVSEGTANASTLWTLSTPTPITLDTTSLSFTIVGSNGAVYATDTGSANAYAIAPGAPISAYVAGQQFIFKAANSNTGASTLAVSGLGTKNLTKFGTTALAAGDIVAGQAMTVVYDGTEFQVLDAGVTPVANGGTGATTAVTALTNLGAANSGANSSITSLTGLTTALSVAQGGTGSTSASGARTNLSAAASGANSDLTSISALTGSITSATGSITSNKPALTATQTWNSSGTAFQTINLNVTNTASAIGSNVLQTQLGGTTVFGVNVSGSIQTSGVKVSVNAKSAAYTATVNDFAIPVTAGSGGVTITLPASSSSKGQVLYLQKVDSAAGAVTITPNGSDKINGASSASLASQYNSLTIVADGSGNWLKIAST